MTENHLNVLKRVLHSHSPKWREIGGELGFADPELNLISHAPLLLTTAPFSYLAQLLSQWVQWPTANHPTKPILGVLCTALRSSVVGLGSLAERVEEEVIRSNEGN